MLNADTSVQSSVRTPAVDVVRGLALFGICVVNVPFMAGPVELLLVQQTPTDHAVSFVVEMLFQGKFFLLFSFVFGWGMGLQIISAAKSGRSARARVISRSVALAAIGISHALLVFFGDILLLYAGLGLLVFGLRDLTPRRLMSIAGSCIMLGIVVLAGVAAIAIAAPAIAPPTPSEWASSGYLGSFAASVMQRASDWPLALLFIVAFNGPGTFAALCAGLAAAKVGFFEAVNNHRRRLSQRVPLLLAIGLPLNALYAASVSGILGEGYLAVIGFAGLAVGGPCLAAVYLAGAIRLASVGSVARATSAAGRMSLTCYVLEGIIAGLIFNGYGLALYGRVDALGCFAIACTIHAATHLFAALWLAGRRQGPLEFILHSATHGAR